MTAGPAGAAARRGGALDRIERLGNALPDPVVIFLWLIVALVLISMLAAANTKCAAPSGRRISQELALSQRTSCPRGMSTGCMGRDGSACR